MRFVFLLLCCATLAACSTTQPPHANTTFDAALAERLGANERGMRQYVVVILKTGPRTEFAEGERQRLSEGHMANVRRLRAERRLLIAGPFSPNDDQYRGMFIFDVRTVEEAVQLAATDPAIAAGVFAIEAYPWTGSAALMEAPAIHERVERDAH